MMLHPASLTLLASLASVLCCLALLRLLRRGSAVTQHSTLAGIRALLHPADKARFRREDLLAERAISNQRLVRAFGLSNTFVSSDPAVHSAFVSASRTLIFRATKMGWARFAELASQAVQHELEVLVNEGDAVAYGPFISAVTLRTILVGLIGAESSIEDFSRKDIRTATGHINELWTLSKAAAPLPPHLLPQLNAALKRLLPQVEAFSNPIDIVIPTWETLWRVVATTIAYTHESDELGQVLSDFYHSPSDATYRRAAANSTGATPVSAKQIVDEAMRLHPPVKRIGRMRLRYPSLLRVLQRLPDCLSRHIWGEWVMYLVYSKEVADIQAVLVAPEMWGSSSSQSDDAAAETLSFDPARQAAAALDHQCTTANARKRQEAASYVFGGGPLRCVASSWAPMAATLIAGAVLEGADSGKVGSRQFVQFEIRRGGAIGGREGWEGWSVVKKGSSTRV